MPGFYNSLALVDVITVLEPGRAGTTSSGAIDIAKYEGEVIVVQHAKHAAGTGPTQDAVLHFSDDDGVADPYAVDPALAAFVQVTDAGGAGDIALRKQTLRFNVNGRKRYMKWVGTVGGTSTPTFDRSVLLVAFRKDHSQA